MALGSSNKTSGMKKKWGRFAGASLIALTLYGCAASETMSNQELTDERVASKAEQLVRIGKTTRKGGDLRSAATFFNRAAVLNPESQEPLYELGITLAALKEYRSAAEPLKRAIRIDGDNPEARRVYGNVLIALDRPNDAIAQFQAARELKENAPRIHNGLGVAFDMTGQHEKAQESYKTAIKQDPDGLSAKNNLALSLAINGDYEEAILLLQDVTNSPLSSARNRLNLALVYGLMGDLNRAALTAAKDLPQDDVRKNLMRYQELSRMNAEARAEALLRRKAAQPKEAMNEDGGEAAPVAAPARHVEEAPLEEQSSKETAAPVAKGTTADFEP